MVRASRRARVGVNRNRRWDEVDGWMGSLMNSLTPSASG